MWTLEFIEWDEIAYTTTLDKDELGLFDFNVENELYSRSGFVPDRQIERVVINPERKVVSLILF